MRLGRGIAVLAVCALGACATPAPTPVAEGAPDAWFARAPVVEPAFWQALASAQGDPFLTDAIWTAGDTVSYRIVAKTAAKERSWQLQLTLPALPAPVAIAGAPVPYPFRADPRSGYVRTRGGLWQSLSSNSGADGAETQHMTRYSRRVVHRVEFVDERGEQVVTNARTQTQAHVWQSSVLASPRLGLDWLFRILLEVDHLFEVMLSVVQRPSLGSILLRAGKVQVGLRYPKKNPHEVIAVQTPFGEVPAVWVPVELRANEQPALHCHFLITWKRSPLLVSAGILGMRAEHPSDPSKTLTATLVRARRGVFAPQVDRSDLGEPGLRVGQTREEFYRRSGWGPSRRRTVLHPDGREWVLESVARPGKSGQTAVFAAGRLLYVSYDGDVATFLANRGFPAGSALPSGRR